MLSKQHKFTNYLLKIIFYYLVISQQINGFFLLPTSSKPIDGDEFYKNSNLTPQQINRQMMKNENIVFDGRFRSGNIDGINSNTLKYRYI
ncbi:Hypothetical protein SRAE_2000379150 [Strongyloides ratti]|uniref:Uncharacterized protein n=1 Tax=Strongyloides ratti TaxID=34506 RepID=A0A090LNN9_STRRB|nr:Hypothetical protein SRAE_2000379150 [Strongyloides ratti]CEF69140.1 Hypothetical protein SRAE_2000379150 [Strongyloides ratti]